MNYIFKTEDVVRMVTHWLTSEVNGYVGVSYGRNLSEFLLIPLDDDRADQLLSWLKADIPVLKNLSDRDLSVVSQKIGVDKRKFFIKVGTELIHVQDD